MSNILLAIMGVVGGVLGSIFLRKKQSQVPNPEVMTPNETQTKVNSGQAVENYETLKTTHSELAHKLGLSSLGPDDKLDPK
jgi:hypothetical protein